MESKRFNLNDEEKKKIINNALVFLAPMALVFLTAIQSGVPLKDAMFAVYLYALNVLIDLLKKFVQGSKI